MIGKEPPPPWLQTDWILGQFSDHRNSAITRYIDFVRAGVGQPSLWEQLHGQLFLGGEAFIAKMQSAMSAQIGSAEIPRVQRRPVAKPLAHYRDNAEDIKAGMMAAYATGDYTMQQIADCFDVHYATVSRAVAQTMKNDAFRPD